MHFDLNSLAEHQHEGLNGTLQVFQRGNRAQVHMACGTGKTRLGQAVAFATEADCVLVLLPSLSLISQTLAAWISLGQLPLDRILCVCSDPSVAESEDEDVGIVDLPVEVTTDPLAIGTFVERRSTGPLYVFCTYHSVPTLAAGLPVGFLFDLGIFDEAHRTAGYVDAGFTFALHDHSTLKIGKRLFLTATPKHLPETARAGFEVYSMCNEEVYGPVAYHLSMQEAIARGIICDFQVIITVVGESGPELRDAYEVVEEDWAGANATIHAVELVRAMQQVGARKAFTFHNFISQSRLFSDTLNKVGDRLAPGIQGWHVDGRMAGSERHLILRQFIECDMGVVSNARCLSEGTDAPVVDMVGFLDPKESSTDIVQALGRALRRAPGKLKGYVLLPVRLKLGHGETVQQALARSSMKHIWRVLSTVAELDDRIKDELVQIRRRVDPDSWGITPVSSLLDKLEVHAPAELLEAVKEFIQHQLVDRLTVSWETSFGHLQRYLEEFGHCAVPKRYVTANGSRLGLWCAQQRTLYAQGVLADDRRVQLEAIGFDFDPHATSWAEAFQELRQYKRDQGHANVPAGHVTGTGRNLGTWCSEQRKAYRAGRLSDSREEQLRSEGFAFAVNEDLWEENFSALQAFIEQNGHSNVPETVEGSRGIKLADWLRNQRTRRITLERKRRLEEVGVSLQAVADSSWEDGFEALLEYFEDTLSPSPPLEYESPGGFALGTWVSYQRQRYQAGKLELNRVSRLERLGFVFNMESAAFEDGLMQLRLFQSTHGHCDVPTTYVTAAGYKLGSWCSNQRTRLKSRPEDPRAKALIDLGFKMDPIAAAWEKHFTLATAYVAEHGSMPSTYQASSGEKVGAWLYRQQQKLKKGTLPEEQARLLADSGLA
ncbi:hypothetical protein APB20_19470 [Pseudomonas aeruginosa]|uniref:DEAD/DEAH box helicase n=1 Tax=Pseudomonas aeruginosa TaxID=287 RepID=UPI00071C0D2A|nr:DEAD/DEAH box helicase [Pseudomonas aeruginosa]KSP81217.1 hypothetical protein APB20_19470 [Pseudomonas aeruginosa]